MKRIFFIFITVHKACSGIWFLNITPVQQASHIVTLTPLWVYTGHYIIMVNNND